MQGKSLLISSPVIDAGYLIQCAPLDSAITYSSPGYPVLLVALEYLTSHALLLGSGSSCSTATSTSGTSAASSFSSRHGGGQVPLQPILGAAASGSGSGTAANSGSSFLEMTCSPEQGLLTLTFYKATNLAAAYEEAQELVRGTSSCIPPLIY